MQNFVAVSIGYNTLQDTRVSSGDYSFYAKEATKRTTKFTGIPSVVFGEKEIEITKKQFPQVKDWSCSKLSWLLKYRVFDLLPSAETILYQDSDWCLLKPWNVQQFYNIPEFVGVRDRTWALLDKNTIKLSNPLTYINAGFFICCRKYHREVLNTTLQHYINRDKAWVYADQCCLNYTLEQEKTKRTFLPRLYNLMDPFGEALNYTNLTAIHSTILVFNSLETNSSIPTNNLTTWDLQKMQLYSGGYLYYTSQEKPETIYLYPDGTTTIDRYWYVEGNSIKFVDPYYNPKPTTLIKIT
jgi:lipopolysaccharide biosynthesis glycosyltransferase